MTRFFLAIAIIFSASAVLADRPVTPVERAAIERALAAEGCKGGEMEFYADDNVFEVDGTTCADGKLWTYDLDASYNVLDKELQEEDGDDDDDDGPQDDGDDGDDKGPQDDDDQAEDD